MAFDHRHSGSVAAQPAADPLDPQPGIGQLSRPRSELRSEYDAVVVGSGYGGSVAACRLAQAGFRVCLLERGRERSRGEYPSKETEVLASWRAQGKFGRIGTDRALFDIRFGDGMHVIQGCGLGGTSQINAGVALQPGPEVFTDSRWPRALRATGALDPYFERARTMLDPQCLPDASPWPSKTRAHAAAAQRMGVPHRLVPITVRFSAGKNGAGVEQPGCTACGECSVGCNVGAKGSTTANYLPLAVRFGAEIYTEIRVSRVARAGTGWTVHLESGHGEAAQLRTIHARSVVLAAGALGSTEILLRSAAHGLTVSPVLGSRFSGNGDALAFAYNTAHQVDAIGRNAGRDAPARPGPCITSMLRVDLDDGTETHWVQEGIIPGPAASVVTRVMPWLAQQTRLREAWPRLPPALDPAAAHTQTLLLVGNDDAYGELFLEEDALHIRTSARATDPAVQRRVATLRRTAHAMGGQLLDFPVSARTFGSGQVTVHPLGGCPMGQEASDGVVDAEGLVFADSVGERVHRGLYVCDGAVLPRSLGVNPLLTICALAERISDGIAASMRAGGEQLPAPTGPNALGLAFEETMHGELELLADSPLGRQGRRTRCTLTLTANCPDFEAFLADPEHQMGGFGTLHFASAPAKPISLQWGQIRLFPESERASTSCVQLSYVLWGRDANGNRYRMEGHKRFGRSATGVLRDTTQLYLTLTRSDAPTPLLRGALRIGHADTVRLLASMRVLNASTRRARRTALRRFLEFFLRQTVSSYLKSNQQAVRAAAHGARRALRAPEAVSHAFQAADGTRLLLTRHHGGDKGPVILAPGFAMSADCFALGSVPVNLVEWLAEHAYDVWSFDYRSSPRLAAAVSKYSIDDIALLDWPSAVAHVLRATGREGVAILAHCAGSMTAMMALAAGLQGVRSLIASQLTLHPVSSGFNRVKASLHLSDVCAAIGIRSASVVSPASARPAQIAAVERGRWAAAYHGRRLDRARLYAMFGATYFSPRMSDATLMLLPSYFGAVSAYPFDQLTRIIRTGRAVDRHGRDSYLQHPERLRLPTLMLAGAENRLFLPETSRRTWSWLREHNDPRLYERRVLANYAHLDCFMGEDAAKDVFPMLLDHLERHA